MLKIRLQRTGRTHEPSFRLVLTDSKNSTKSGKAVEVLGSHDFRKETTAIKADRVKYWISQGAQPTDTVHNLLLNHKIIEGKKKNVLPKKTVPKKEEPAAETATPVAEEAPATPVEPSVAPDVSTEAPAADAPAPAESTAPESDAPAAESIPVDPA